MDVYFGQLKLNIRSETVFEKDISEHRDAMVDDAC